MRTPFLSTPTELTLLALYPLTLLLGSLFTTFSPFLSPPTNLSKYSHTYQSYQPASLAPSYFATKRNVFNLYFVKIGWFWSTLALSAFTLLAARGRAAIDVGFAAGNTRRERVLWSKTVRMGELDETDRARERDGRLRRVYQVIMRWGLLTGAWGVMTQWFMGTSIIDRVFSATGGACYEVLDEGRLGPRITGAGSFGQCKRQGGRFAGGLDISGHVFLLVLGSGMVFAEALPIVLPWVAGLTGGRVVRSEGRVQQLEGGLDGNDDKKQDGVETPSHSYSTRSASRAKQVVEQHSQFREKPLTTRLKEYALWLTTAVVVLSWWMLLMTAAFFHTWLEKGSALVVSVTCLWMVYVMPRAVEGLRAVVGLPGV